MESEFTPDYVYCGKQKFQSLPDFGYFTFAAATNNISMDDHDLYFLETQALSTPTALPSTNHSLRNRQILEDFVLERRPKKIKRRQSMKYMKKYLEGKAEPELSDAFRLVKEAIWRANQSITKSFLYDMINRSVDQKIMKARRRLEFAHASFQTLSGDLDQIWAHFKGELESVDTEMRAAMQSMERDVLKMSKVMSMGRESKIYRWGTTRIVRELRSPTLSVVFVVICILEFGAFLIFLLVQGNRTQGFKKFD
jgi:hypothetical protein